MEVLKKFITATAKGMRGVRVVSTKVTLEDLSMFKLMPYEKISLFQSKNRQYVELTSGIRHSSDWVHQRLNKISEYLTALYQ